MASQTPAIYSVEEGQHCVLESRNDLPLNRMDHLGHGRSTSVEKVQDISNGTIYARKIYKFGGDHAEQHRAFENEVQIIKRLPPHHHVIRVVATYTAKHEVGVILSPVANQGSLNDLLQESGDGELSFDNKMLLWESFGCLASGLYFMHTQNVRHKDIKPHNILIHNNSFIYTDFGCFLDHSPSPGSVTTGLSSAVTQRYAAPEIAEHQPRRSKTDIFSLGCVFLEVLAALHNRDLGDEYRPYRTHLNDIIGLLGTMEIGGWGRVIPGMVESMLSYSCDSRPSAFDISAHLWNESEHAFCNSCKTSLPSMDSMTFGPHLLFKHISQGDRTTPSDPFNMMQHKTQNHAGSAIVASQGQDSQALQGYHVNPQFTNSFQDLHRPVPGASHFITHNNTVPRETEQDTRPSTQNTTASSSRTDMPKRNEKKVRCQECGEFVRANSDFKYCSFRFIIKPR
jgi:serine/threonine protein kinase